MAEYIERDKTCEDCVHYGVCYHVEHYGRDIETDEPCEKFKSADVVEVVRCKDCNFATELDKHCDINRTAYKHCILLRGDETRNVWHKYKKYYKDYSLVEADDFCSYGERKCEDG